MLLFAYISLALTACYFYVRAGLRVGAFRWFPMVPAIVIAFSMLGLVKQSWSDVRTALWILLGAVVVGFGRHRSLALNSGEVIAANSRAAGSNEPEVAPAARQSAGSDALTEPSPV
jgi:hypothetical protein